MRKYILGSFFFLLVLQGCGEEKSPHKLLEKGRFALIKTLQFVLTDENLTQPIQLEMNQGEAIINFDKGKQRIMGHYNPSDKIKYLNHLGDVLAFMRPSEDGFVLYNAEKRMAWQIKILPDKIQISDNPQNNSPHELRLAENGAYRVFANGNKLVGDVQCKQGALVAKGNKRYETPSKANHPAFGILLINDIPEEWRLIIWTELLRY
jgi:hypothetical protein